VAQDVLVIQFNIYLELKNNMNLSEFISGTQRCLLVLISRLLIMNVAIAMTVVYTDVSILVNNCCACEISAECSIPKCHRGNILCQL